MSHDRHWSPTNVLHFTRDFYNPQAIGDDR